MVDSGVAEGPPAPPRPTAWLWYVGGFVVVATAGFFFLRWLAHEPPANPSTKSLAAAWGEAIQTFGIEPIFPPEEDLVVGDVLAVILQDNDPLPVKRSDAQSETLEAEPIDFRTPFLKRTVKLAHVDVREELEKNYAKLSTFPGSAAAISAAAAADGQPPPGGIVRLFTKGVTESNLPRAAFASLKSAANRNVAGAIITNEQASASYGGSNQGYEEFQLSEVSTYGLPSARALDQLNTYCEQQADDCRESTVRKHLQPLIGDRIFAKYLDPQGREFNAVDVGIVIVNRVYLARSIVHRRREGRLQSGGFFASLFSNAGERPSAVTTEQPPPAPAAGGTASQGTPEEALKKRLDELEKQVARMRTGTGFSTQSSASAESAFDTGRLDRPVAFGYRFVRFEFPKADERR
jgi:hypothetical protein